MYLCQMSVIELSTRGRGHVPDDHAEYAATEGAYYPSCPSESGITAETGEGELTHESIVSESSA